MKLITGMLITPALCIPVTRGLFVVALALALVWVCSARPAAMALRAAATRFVWFFWRNDERKFILLLASGKKEQRRR